MGNVVAEVFKYILANPQVIEEVVQTVPEVVDGVVKIINDVKSAGK